MLTHVKDHLTGEMIPVRYIEAGTETVLDDWAHIAALARSVAACEAELDAMHGGQIDDLNHRFEEAPADDLDKFIYDLEGACFARHQLTMMALAALASHIAVPPRGMTSTPIQSLLTHTSQPLEAS